MKKPVSIEALQFDGTDESKEALFYFAPGKVAFIGTQIIIVTTLEGSLQGKQGCWVVKGALGEFYPVRDDIFRATYEELPGPIR